MTDATRSSLWPLLFMLLAAVLLIPLERPLFGLPVPWRIGLGALSALAFLWRGWLEPPERRRAYLSLGLPILLLALAPINTDLSLPHMLTLGTVFLAVVLLPPLILRRHDVITFRFWPGKLDWADILYTLLSIPLAWGGFRLYFGMLSPEVPYNWPLPPKPDGLELFKLFTGINAVGVWDELFFVNVCFAVLRFLFPFRVANPAQAVIYTSVLYDMAFSGWGPLFVAILALTQGAMYERSRALLWVLLVHLIVDYFLFQAIVETYYPTLSVWWHP